MDGVAAATPRGKRIEQKERSGDRQAVGTEQTEPPLEDLIFF